MNSHYPFALPPLPYDYEALAPILNADTLHYHHDKHLQTYIDNLNKALEAHPDFHSWSLEQLIADNDKLPETLRTPVRNNGGGVYNHILYFDCMCAAGNAGNSPSDTFKKAIEKDFASMEEMERQLREAGLSQFGSGWAWLCKDGRGKLRVIKTPNQDTPLASGMFPVFLVDVWEHAYYLQYQNRRAEYLDKWLSLIDWKKAEERYSTIK